MHYNSIDCCIIPPTGNGLAISYPYFHKIDSGANVKVQGRVSVFCYYSGAPLSPIGWRYSNQTIVPENPLPFELKARSNSDTKEYVLSTNRYPFSLLNKGRYICDLGNLQSKMEVTLTPRSGTLLEILNESLYDNLYNVYCIAIIHVT